MGHSPGISEEKILELLNPLSKADFPAQSVSYTGTAGSTTASTPIPAYTPIPFKVPTGTSGIWRVSAIQLSAGGTVYAKPMNTK